MPARKKLRRPGLSLRELSTSPALLISLSVSPRPSSPAAFPDTLRRQAPGRVAFAALLVLFGRGCSGSADDRPERSIRWR